MQVRGSRDEARRCTLHPARYRKATAGPCWPLRRQEVNCGHWMHQLDSEPRLRPSAHCRMHGTRASPTGRFQRHFCAICLLRPGRSQDALRWHQRRGDQLNPTWSLGATLRLVNGRVVTAMNNRNALLKPPGETGHALTTHPARHRKATAGPYWPLREGRRPTLISPNVPSCLRGRAVALLW